MSENNSFYYEPLDRSYEEIRLVYLLPGDEWTPLECNLHTVSSKIDRDGDGDGRSIKPDYTALSYAWGPPGNDRPVWIDGSKLMVRKNLWMALFYLRSKLETLTLWIDAICINQSDTNERNHQVAQMGSIYSNAVEVLVWLGMPTDESYTAFELLRKFTPDSALNASQRYTLSLTDRRCLSDVCQRSYWKRLWIVQEVIRASKITVQCGSVTIDWDAMCTGFELVMGTGKHKEEDYLDDLKWLLDLKNQRDGYHQNGCGIISLLETCTRSECLDPRDKVFGLLGLADDCSGVLLADYSKSAAEVFDDVVTFYYNQSLQEEIPAGGLSLGKSCSLVKFAHLMHHLLLRDNDGRSASWWPSNSEEYPNFLDFTGIFRGNIIAMRSAPSQMQESQYLQNRLIDTWFGLELKKRPGRGLMHEALRSELGSALKFDLQESTDRIRSIKCRDSKAIIG